tara:strand:- start:11628 stop:11927 length:300 start_codon:yes stop_codon:yes gene_type:complete
MAKKGPISKIEAFYIENNYRDADIAEIAVDLDRSIKSVETYIKKNITHKAKQTTITAGEHIHHHRGSTIMTETASTLADEKRKPTAVKNKSCITKIKAD